MKSPLHFTLREAAALASDGELRKSLDLAFSEIDRALREGWFETVDWALREFDFETWDLDLSVTALMTCKPAKDRVPSRAAAVERFSLRVRRELPERADVILRYL